MEVFKESLTCKESLLLFIFFWWSTPRYLVFLGILETFKSVLTSVTDISHSDKDLGRKDFIVTLYWTNRIELNRIELDHIVNTGLELFQHLEQMISYMFLVPKGTL